MVFGATRRLPRVQAALEEVLAQVDRCVLRDQIRRGLHVGVRQLVASRISAASWLDDALDVVRAGRVAIHEQLVPLRADADVEERFEMLEVLVVGAEERFDALFGNDPLIVRFTACDISF